MLNAARVVIYFHRLVVFLNERSKYPTDSARWSAYSNALVKSLVVV